MLIRSVRDVKRAKSKSKRWRSLVRPKMSEPNSEEAKKNPPHGLGTTFIAQPLARSYRGSGCGLELWLLLKLLGAASYCMGVCLFTIWSLVVEFLFDQTRDRSIEVLLQAR